MSTVMIKCPTTGLSVSTAIETDRSVFRRLPRVASRMHCPACGQEHVWWTSSAWLSGGPRLVSTTRQAGAAAPSPVFSREEIVGAAAGASQCQPASRNRTAASRSTETNCDTPRSAMVTPYRRFMRAMVIGLCVMITKRVSVDLVISSSRSQKRSTL